MTNNFSTYMMGQTPTHSQHKKLKFFHHTFLKIFFLQQAAILLFSSIIVYSQNLDTTFYDSGHYSTYTRNENGKKEGTVFYYDKNHTLTSTREFTNEIQDGVSTYYYDGKKYFMIPYKNDLFDGELVSYHPNGKIEWLRPYKYGKMNGQRIIRDSTGNLVNGEYTTTDYIRKSKFTINCIEGVPDGEFKIFLFDGTLVLMGKYLKGYPDGIFTYYDSEGEVKSEELYEMGKYIKEVGNNYENQVETYTDLLKNEPNNIRWLLLRAEARIYMNYTLMAKEDFKRILEIDTSSVIALYNLGYLYAAEEEYKLSEQYFLKCIELDNYFYRAYYNLGYIYYQTNKNHDAVKYFSEAIRTKPNYSEAYYNRAQVYKTMGDKKKAKKDMRKYRKLDKIAPVN